MQTARPLIVDAFRGGWGRVVLTYHPALWERLRDARLLARARARAEAMLEAFFLEEAHLPEGWRLGVISVDHPCGDGDQASGAAHGSHVDSDEWFPHHNFMFPLTAFGPGPRAREELVDKVTGEITPAREDKTRRRTLGHWLDPEALERFRGRWKATQEELLERPLEGNVDLNYAYAYTRERKLGELCDYFPRTFPAWPGSGQRLSYFGVFGCRVLRTLREAAALELDAAAADAGATCECGAPFVRIVMVAGGSGPIERSIPHGYRMTTGPPRGG